jgi:hypothetical protein
MTQSSHEHSGINPRAEFRLVRTFDQSWSLNHGVRNLMRISRIALFSILIVGLGWMAPVNADFVVFQVPTTDLTFVLQGKATVSRTQPTMSFAHVSRQTFDLPQLGADVLAMPTLKEMAAKKVSGAKGNEEETMAATVWSLDHGQLPEFHRGLDQLLQANSSHPFGTQAKILKEALNQPIADDVAAEAALLKRIGNSEAKIVKSAHFLLIAPPVVVEKGGLKRKRPEVRAEQLEQLLEVFVMKCAERGLPVSIPKQRFVVALISAAPAPADASLRTRPRDTSIYFSPSQDILYLNDGAKIGALDPMRKLHDKIVELAALPKSKRNPQGQAGGAGAPPMTGGPGASGGITIESFNQLSTSQLQRFQASLQALMTIGVDNFELESTSRESAYLFIRHCGVLPASAPAWLRDGLASYFEYPSDIGWVKLGDIGKVRQAWYLASLQDPERISISDIVCGHCHEMPQSPNEAMRASTQSWALVHFLLEQHPEGIKKFLESMHSLPPDVKIPDDLTMGIFDESFGGDHHVMEESWREHFLAQKPEYKVLQSDDDNPSTAQN